MAEQRPSPSASLRVDALSALVRDWDRTQLAAWIEEAVRLLGKYDAAAKTGDDLQVLREMGKALSPLRVSASVEPSEVLAAALETLEVTAPLLTRSALESIVTRRTQTGLSDEDYVRMLGLLAIAALSSGEQLGFAAVEPLRRLPPELRDEAAGLAVRITRRAGALAALSMLERLSDAGASEPRLLFTALRLVATSEPSRLAPAFQAHAKSLAAAAASAPRDAAYFLLDLTRRAGATTVLSCIGLLDLETCSAFWRAAFGAEGAPFLFVLKAADDPREQRLWIRFEGEDLPASVLGEIDNDPEALLKLRYLVEPRISVQSALPRQVVEAANDSEQLDTTVAKSLAVVRASA